MNFLPPLLAFWQEILSGAFYVFLRVGAIMALLPAFGERSVPVRVRLALTILFTVILAPAAAPEFAGLLLSPSAIIRVGGIEVIAGLAVGVVLRLLVLALQMAGTIAANVTSLSHIFGGTSVDPQPAMAHLMVVGGLALAAMAGLHVKAAEAMLLSYELFPPGRLIPAPDFAYWGTRQVARAFALAFSLAAPFVLVAVIYNLALGAINRAMPQLMVAFVGAPAITMAGLVLMLLATPFLLGLWRDALDQVLSTLGTI